MDDVILQLITALAGFAAGALIILVYRKVSSAIRLNLAEQQAREILRKAEEDAGVLRKKLELEMKDQLVELKEELKRRFDKETREKREELKKEEKRLEQKEEKIDRKLDALEKRGEDLEERHRELDAARAEIAEVKERELRKLEQIAGMTTEEAKREMMTALESELTAEMAVRIKRHEDEIREQSERKAKWVISTAIQRCAMDHNVDSLVTVVQLPDEDMKGRIIGREGRNIRTLEALTGISVIIDDTPQAVVLSGFNNIKREIARLSLEKLIHDGRIHPARIEEVVLKTTAEMDQTIREIGERTAIELGVHGLHPELITLIGKLNYRTSYGQNQLQHTKEVAILAATMAAEIGADVQVAKRAGLLHDIGKVLSHEIEGTHTQIGGDIARKYGEPAKVINAIVSHHEDVPAECVEAILIAAADAISASREGARHETLEAYVKRIEKLEEIGKSFREVQNCYALQAGREVRVIVDPVRADDATLAKIVRDIRQRIENELEFPGQIKITAIRETRAVEYAK